METIQSFPVQPTLQVPPVVGRNQWDALVELVRLLGKGAPYILVLAAVIYAFYKFEEQSNLRVADTAAAQERAAKEYKEQLAAANSALVSTYKQIGDISTAQIGNLRNTVTLHDEMSAQILERQRRSFELQTEAAEAARVRDETLRTVTELRATVASLKGDLQDAQNSLSAVTPRQVPFAAALPAAKSIGDRIKALKNNQALLLAKAMDDNIKKRPKALVELMRNIDPNGKRLTDGAAARQVLLQWQAFDDRDEASLKQWTDALSIIETS